MVSLRIFDFDTFVRLFSATLFSTKSNMEKFEPNYSEGKLSELSKYAIKI